MKLRVLIVEDEDIRMEIFNGVFRNDEVHRAVHAETGVAHLRHHGPFDLLMLDHDLGIGSSGHAVAREVCVLPETVRPFVIIHSWNPDGALAISRLLQQYRVGFVRCPFGKGIGLVVNAFRQQLEKRQ